MSRMLNKFRGTLVGALVGDCLGSHYEGVSSILPWAEVINYTSTKIKDNRGLIPYTDDSAMTRAICKSLTMQKKYDNCSMAYEFVGEFFRDRHRGYGAAVGTVFERLRDENPEDVTLPARSQFDGQGSYGNGAAMRISPVALFSQNSAEVQKVRSDDVQVYRNSYIPGGGTLYIFRWGCAAGTMKPLPYTRPRSADFVTPYPPNPYSIPDLLFF